MSYLSIIERILSKDYEMRKITTMFAGKFATLASDTLSVMSQDRSKYFTASDIAYILIRDSIRGNTASKEERSEIANRVSTVMSTRSKSGKCDLRRTDGKVEPTYMSEHNGNRAIGWRIGLAKLEHGVTSEDFADDKEAQAVAELSTNPMGVVIGKLKELNALQLIEVQLEVTSALEGKILEGERATHAAAQELSRSNDVIRTLGEYAKNLG